MDGAWVGRSYELKPGRSHRTSRQSHARRPIWDGIITIGQRSLVLPGSSSLIRRGSDRALSSSRMLP
jgi:hypothetical protein